VSAEPTPVLEVGGTHVTAALLDPRHWSYLVPPHRTDLDGHGSAAEILGAFGDAARTLDAAAGASWGVAMPDPFDYEHGIGRFHGVAKFEALDGVDVRAALREALPTPRSIAFVNDADAFALGEAAQGAASGRRRVAGLTLGTGVGSGWVVDGHVVSEGPGIPPGGRIHQLDVLGRPLEDVMSRRAIRRAYRDAGGHDAAGDDVDVREIADRARHGEATAIEVLQHALCALGKVVGACVLGFGADVLVVGGSMAGSWQLFEPWFRSGSGELPAEIVVSADSERAGLVGAALTALDR
jgi:glucokinase